MKNLSTDYLGLKLKNPIIAASSGLTGNIEGLKAMEKNGAAAVVLKSIFEEEILVEVKQQAAEAEANPLIYSGHSEALDYIDLHVREDRLGIFLELISEAKSTLNIPVIPSINCVSGEDWIHFTRKMADAGADALELNLFLSPADFENKEFEKAYFDIIGKVLNTVQIPVAIKISKYFTRMGLTLKALGETGIAGMVLFNRFYSPDIDIDKMSLSAASTITSPEEIHDTLRWTAIMSSRVDCDLAATTGIHSGKDVIKMILAGASAVQIASVLYKKGPEYIGEMLKDLEQWMEEKGLDNIAQFKGKVMDEYEGNPAAFERMQFMRHFSEIR